MFDVIYIGAGLATIDTNCFLEANRRSISALSKVYVEVIQRRLFDRCSLLPPLLPIRV
jgi:hypothetical protein